MSRGKVGKGGDKLGSCETRVTRKIDSVKFHAINDERMPPFVSACSAYVGNGFAAQVVKKVVK